MAGPRTGQLTKPHRGLRFREVKGSGLQKGRETFGGPTWRFISDGYGMALGVGQYRPCHQNGASGTNYSVVAVGRETPSMMQLMLEGCCVTQCRV